MPTVAASHAKSAVHQSRFGAGMRRPNKGRINRGSKESAQYQVQLGRYLAREKRSCQAAGLVWKIHVKENFHLSRERADELIRIGRGVITVEEYRRKKQGEQRSYRKARNLNDAAKSKLLGYAKASIEASHKAKLRSIKNDFSPEDILEMRGAISEAIFSWQELFDILK